MNKTLPWILLTALVLIGVWRIAASSSPQPLPEGWQSGVDLAQVEAREGGRPIFLLATADWCGPCQSFKKNVLADPAVDAELQKKFTLVTLDVTSPDSPDSAAAQKLNIEAIPTMILLSPDKKELSRHVGGMDRDDFTKWIASGLKKL